MADLRENVWACKKCGDEVSGPDKKDVAATVKRHKCAKKAKAKK